MSTEHQVERYGYKDNRVPFSSACGTKLTFFRLKEQSVLCFVHWRCVTSDAITIVRATMKQTLYQCLQSASY
jgi:hypothetical protein